MARSCEVKWPKVYIYGDSITQKSFSYDGCWGGLLADALIRHCDVINRGLGGYNSRWNKILLPRIFPAGEADDIHLVIVFLGANDAVLPQYHAAVPLDEYKINLVSIIDHLMAIGVKRDHIMLVDPPATNPDALDESEETDDGFTTLFGGKKRTTERTREYAHACVDVAKQWRVGYIELFDNMMACPNWKDMLVDGLHFNHLGAEFMFKLLWPWVHERCKDLPMVLPDYNSIDAKDPEKSLTPGGQ